MDRRLVFYQIAPSWLPHLHDHGFSFFKLGEEAIHPLRGSAWMGALEALPARHQPHRGSGELLVHRRAAGGGGTAHE